MNHLARCACVVWLLVCACITPPIVKTGGASRVVLDTPARKELGAELVELAVEPGITLRGVFVAAGEHAPIAVTLLGSGGSVSRRQHTDGLVFDLDGLMRELRELGVASLIVDYRGVGASSGERDPRHMPDDALAIWNEALRRAGGESKRIVLRGMSIGTLAVASLLQRGVEPAAVVLYAPVRAETIASNWLAFYQSPLASWLVSPLLRKPLDADLVTALARAPRELDVFAGVHDALLTSRERELVRQAVHNAGGNWFELDADHVHTVNLGYALRPDEERVFERAFATDRFAPPAALDPKTAAPQLHSSTPR